MPTFSATLPDDEQARDNKRTMESNLDRLRMHSSNRIPLDELFHGLEKNIHAFELQYKGIYTFIGEVYGLQLMPADGFVSDSTVDKVTVTATDINPVFTGSVIFDIKSETSGIRVALNPAVARHIYTTHTYPNIRIVR